MKLHVLCCYALLSASSGQQQQATCSDAHVASAEEETALAADLLREMNREIAAGAGQTDASFAVGDRVTVLGRSVSRSPATHTLHSELKRAG